MIFLLISATFFTIDFWSKPVLEIWPFAKKCVKPKIGQDDPKMEKQMARIVFLQIYVFFFSINFWYELLWKFRPFCKKVCKATIGLNGQKMEKQMARSDFYAKIYIFLYYRFLIWVFKVFKTKF